MPGQAIKALMGMRLQFSTECGQSCHTYGPAVFTPQEIALVLIPLEAELIPGPWCDQKEQVNEKSQCPIRNRTHDILACSKVESDINFLNYNCHFIWFNNSHT